MLAIHAVFLIGCIIKLTLVFRVGYHFVNEKMWIVKPDVVVHSCPQRAFTIRPKGFRWSSIIVHSKTLPGNVSEGCGIVAVQGPVAISFIYRDRMLYTATTLFLASSLQDSLWAHSPFSAIWEIPGCSMWQCEWHSLPCPEHPTTPILDITQSTEHPVPRAPRTQQPGECRFNCTAAHMIFWLAFLDFFGNF